MVGESGLWLLEIPRIAAVGSNGDRGTRWACTRLDSRLEASPGRYGCDSSSRSHVSSNRMASPTRAISALASGTGIPVTGP